MAENVFTKFGQNLLKSTGSWDRHHFLKFCSKSVKPIQYSNETMFSQILGQNLWKSNGSWDEQCPLGVQRLPICMILSHPRTHPPHIHTIKQLLSIIIYHKVKMCLARYSPRATSTNQPTNQKGTKWGGKAWPKNANFGPNLVVLGKKS